MGLSGGSQCTLMRQLRTSCSGTVYRTACIAYPTVRLLFKPTVARTFLHNLPAPPLPLFNYPPGARNLPFPTLLEAGAYRPRDQLAAAFAAAGLDVGGSVVGSCGSGLTACILALGLYQVNGQLVGGGGRGGFGGRATAEVCRSTRSMMRHKRVNPAQPITRPPLRSRRCRFRCCAGV